MASVTGVIVFASIGAVLLVGSHAATPAASVEAESGSLSANAHLVNDSSASGSAAVKFVAGSTGSTSSTCSGFPNAACTGIPSGVTLTDTTLDTRDSNITYTNKRFTNNDITVTGSNLTFTNCIFPAGVIFRSGTNITITHSDLTGISFSSSHTVRFTYNNIHDFDDDGIDVTSDVAGAPQASDIVMSENYVHKPIAQYPSHSDGLQVRGVAGLTLQHDTFDLGVWYTTNNDPNKAVLNAALYLEDANGGNSGVMASNNYLNGGIHTLEVLTGSGSITNNTFGLDTHGEEVYGGKVGAGYTCTGNIDTNGKAVSC